MASKKEQDRKYQVKTKITVRKNLDQIEKQRVREENEIIRHIKKFVYQFLQVIDKFRKDKARAELDDSDDEFNPRPVSGQAKIDAAKQAAEMIFAEDVGGI